MKLREKLLLPFVVTVVVGMAVMVSYLYVSSVDTISQEIQKGMENEASLSVEMIDSWLDGSITDFLTWRNLPVYREAVIETGYYGRSARIGASLELANLAAGYQYYEYLFLADREGKIVSASSSDRKNDFRIDDRPYFIQTMTGRTTISGILKSRRTGNQIFVIAVPVYDGDEVVGILAGSIALKAFGTMFARHFNSGPEGFAFMAEQNGRIFLSSPERLTFERVQALPVADNILLQERGMAVMTHEGKTRITGFHRVPATGWIIVEARSLDKALEPIIKTRQLSIVVGAITLLLILFLVGLMFRKILGQPLQETLKVIKEVDRGNLKVRIPVGRKSDELGILISAFNAMVDRLRQTHESLRREIEERKTAEAELARHRDNLESLVSVRTIALEKEHEERKQLENRLHMAEKMEAIGTLAGGVAHDLNNILSGILSYPELILMDLPSDSSLRPQIEMIHNSGKKAAAIVQDLLTLARRGVHVTEISNLNALINEYIASPEYEKMMSFHPGVFVTTELDPKLVHTSGSSVHLSKTVMNLVSNAAEAMPDGGEMRIQTRNRFIEKPLKGYDFVRPGKYAELTVSDTGVGISSKDIGRVYEPFYTKKKMGRSGTGLGMAVVWGTVKDHGGYILCESKEGVGTTFTVYFRSAEEMSEKEAETTTPGELKGDGQSVVIIDDSKEQREIASAIVERLGYRATTFDGGEAALAWLAENSADIIILDMIMDPGIDGLETYAQILELHPGQKAIIASGYSETERIKKTIELGAGQYVPKPYTIETIGRALREELKK